MTQHAQKYQNEGLEDAATRYGVFCDTRSEFERYIEEKHLVKPKQSVAPYTPPEPETEQEQPVITLTMKRYFAAGTVTTAWACFFSLCEHGAFTAAASVLGWVIAGGCGLAFVSALFRNCFSWSGSVNGGGGSKQETHHHYYYQNNNQGPGGQQNTNQK